MNPFTAKWSEVIDGFYLAPLLWFQRSKITPEISMQTSEAKMLEDFTLGMVGPKLEFQYLQPEVTLLLWNN